MAKARSTPKPDPFIRTPNHGRYKAGDKVRLKRGGRWEVFRFISHVRNPETGAEWLDLGLEGNGQYVSVSVRTSLVKVRAKDEPCQTSAGL